MTHKKKIVGRPKKWGAIETSQKDDYVKYQKAYYELVVQPHLTPKDTVSIRMACPMCNMLVYSSCFKKKVRLDLKYQTFGRHPHYFKTNPAHPFSSIVYDDHYKQYHDFVFDKIVNVLTELHLSDIEKLRLRFLIGGKKETCPEATADIESVATLDIKIDMPLIAKFDTKAEFAEIIT